MSNYNQQQQAVILKGIASQILNMNIPSFDTIKRLFKEFDIDFGSEIFQSAEIFSGHSHLMGTIEERFSKNAVLNEDECQQYLGSCKMIKEEIDENIKEYILRKFPYLLQ